MQGKITVKQYSVHSYVRKIVKIIINLTYFILFLFLILVT